MPFGQRHVAINIYNLCKGHYGSRRGKDTDIPDSIAAVITLASLSEYFSEKCSGSALQFDRQTSKPTSACLCCKTS